MRTTDFSRILFDALQYSGNDRHNIGFETFAQFRDFANARLREAWESYQWNDVCRVEAFTATVGSDGVNSFTPASDAGEVFAVWNKNPLDTTKAKQYNHTVYDDGTNKKIIVSDSLSTGFYYYRKQCPELTGDLYSSTQIYYLGAQVYFDTGSASGTYTPVIGKPHNGNFYICLSASTNIGQSPSSRPDLWSKINIPFIFASYISWASAASYFGSESQTQEAITVEQKANQILDQEYDKQGRQQSQNTKLNINNTY